MADFPFCRNSHFPKKRLVLKEERDDIWVLECPLCKSIQVMTKTNEEDRIRFDKQIRDKEEIARRIREREKRPKIFA